MRLACRTCTQGWHDSCEAWFACTRNHPWRAMHDMLERNSFRTFVVYCSLTRIGLESD